MELIGKEDYKNKDGRQRLIIDLKRQRLMFMEIPTRKFVFQNGSFWENAV